jgi:hypothetical protein
MSPRRRDARFQRLEIAQFAARLLVEGSAQSFGSAKRKAAAAMAATAREDLPDNLTLLAAVIDYQQLFDRSALPIRNERLRRAALSAMHFLQDFEPRLHGPILYGTSLRYSAVSLHLFADEIERLSRHLINHRIQYQLGESLHGARKQSTARYPTFALSRDGVDFELTLLPRLHLKQPLINPLNTAPYRYFDYAQLTTLLAHDPGGYCLDGLNLGGPE